jgi:hypothetical protein
MHYYTNKCNEGALTYGTVLLEIARLIYNEDNIKQLNYARVQGTHAQSIFCKLIYSSSVIVLSFAFPKHLSAVVIVLIVLIHISSNMLLTPEFWFIFNITTLSIKQSKEK